MPVCVWNPALLFCSVQLSVASLKKKNFNAIWSDAEQKPNSGTSETLHRVFGGIAWVQLAPFAALILEHSAATQGVFPG